MGLMEDAHWGVSVIHHGGDLAGYHSDFMLIPSAQVGAVILTNSQDGAALRGPFLRRLLEVLYDGHEEAAGDVAAIVKAEEAQRVEFRRRLVVPPAEADAAQLASSYGNPDLGRLQVQKEGRSIRFRTAAFVSPVASRHNDDGTLSFLTIDPALTGLTFVVGGSEGKRTLTTRDGQHVYVFNEAPPP